MRAIPSANSEGRVRNAILIRRTSVERLALVLVAMALSTATFAAGIDSRTYTCADLQALIEAKRFVFISQPAFGDFVVSNVSYCPGGNVIELRSVPTTDRPECLVNYCVDRSSRMGN
jgi:hypothetical protein